ncbi:MAG TPA: MFS transporter [Thermoleophilaceae bacterium]|nr:MFS transporter [Thermoleophilaceae bacterium]
MNHTTDTDTAGRREWIGLAVLALPALLVTMDLSVLFLAVPALTRDLAPSSTELLWITDIYGFLIAGSLITMGTLGDRIGRRRLLMIGGFAFAVASVLAAFATSPAMLIAARAVLGVAGATLAPSSLSLIRSLFPDERRRTVAIGIWMSCFAAGAAVGPLVGGALLEQFWWGSVFLLNVPVMAVMLALAPRVLPESRDPSPGRFDIPGAALSVIALLALVYGVKRVAEQGLDGVAVVSALAGLLVGMLFVRRQRRTHDPLIDLGVFRLQAIRVSIASMVLATFVMAGMLLFITQYLQLVRGMGPLEAGLWSVPAMVGSIAGSMLAPAVAARVRKELVLAGSMGLAAAGLGLLALVSDGSTTLAVLVAGSLGMGLGAGAIGTVATDLIVGTAPPERAGAASGISETGAELGGALGIAILGSIGTAVHGEDAFVEGLQLAALTGAALTAVAAAVAAVVLLRFTAPAAGSLLAGSR